MSTAAKTLNRLRIESRPEFADILREEPFARAGVPSDSAERINRAFDRLVLQSGTRLSAAVVLRLCLLFGVAAGGLVFVLFENLLATAMAALAGALMPIVTLSLRRARWREKLSEQLSLLVEQIVRTTRSGAGLEQSLAKLTDRTPSPLGDELRMALRRTQLGLTLSEALSELPARTGLPAMQVLVSAVSLSERHGGNLEDSLDRLAHTLRDRAVRLKRLREANAADRGWSLLVLSVQALIVAVFVVAAPNQMLGMMSGSAGIATIAVASVTLLAGGYSILRLVSAERRV
jgi:Flp pilus assembly protein TadB